MDSSSSQGEKLKQQLPWFLVTACSTRAPAHTAGDPFHLLFLVLYLLFFSSLIRVGKVEVRRKVSGPMFAIFFSSVSVGGGRKRSTPYCQTQSAPGDERSFDDALEAPL